MGVGRRQGQESLGLGTVLVDNGHCLILSSEAEPLDYTGGGIYGLLTNRPEKKPASQLLSGLGACVGKGLWFSSHHRQGRC